MTMGKELLDMVQSIQHVGVSASHQARKQLARDILSLIRRQIAQGIEFEQIIHTVVKKCEDQFYG